MNKKFAWVAVPMLALPLLAGCNKVGTADGAIGSHSAQASADASKGAVTIQDSLATCLPKGTKVTSAYLTTLATSKSARDKLAAECDIPKTTATYPATAKNKEPNRTAFAEAVLLSAGNAMYRHQFKTPAQRDEWANEVFPVILKTYRTK